MTGPFALTMLFKRSARLPLERPPLRLKTAVVSSVSHFFHEKWMAARGIEF